MRGHPTPCRVARCDCRLFQCLHERYERSYLVWGERAHRLDVRGLGFTTLGENSFGLRRAGDLGSHGRLPLSLIAVTHGAFSLEQRGAVLREDGKACQHEDRYGEYGCNAEF